MRCAIYLGIGTLTLAAGCTAIPDQDAVPTSEPPASYRETVATHVRESFFDPYSIRDAEISEPVFRTAIFDGVTPIPRRAWIVCVRANAKNRMGAYSGRQFTAFVFDREAIALSLSGKEPSQASQHCSTATLQPFQEIESKG